MKEVNTVTVNNIKYLIKNKNDIIQSTLLKGNQWNNDVVLLIGYWIKKFNLKHFVNVGSHIGTVALPLSKYIKKVTAIESFPPTYKHFLEHIKLNDIKNVDSFNVAAGDKENKVYFLDSSHERIKNNSGGIHAVTEEDIKKNRLSSILHSKKYYNTMKRIDDLPVEKFDIMLVDVEGREYETIKGAAKKISKNKPIIIIEIWENPKRKQENMLTTKEEVLAYINNLDYKLVKQLNDNYIFFPKNLKI
tara:strand:- start:2614 stop:3354 length:741 start_codon:yes stop_codon:yes gene_type:complete